MELKNNVLREHLKNAYFITGTPYAGKSTMCKMLSQRYGLLHFGENYTHDDALKIADAENQPNLSYFLTKKSWQEYLSRRPEAYAEWVEGNSREATDFELVSLIQTPNSEKVIVDTNIPIEILKELSDYNHVAVMLSPLSMALERFFDRDDPEKRFLLHEIQKSDDPEWTMGNYLSCLKQTYSPEYYARLQRSGFFTLYRKQFDVDTRAQVLGELSRHFGFSDAVIRLTPDSPFWQETITLAEQCSWQGAGKHLADMMREQRFTDWESVFACLRDDHVVGFCTFLKTDFYPENRYSPWISTIFVEEAHRGKRLSEKLIAAAVDYARTYHFHKVYIPSDLIGLYEKYGFRPIDRLTNYVGDTDTIFMKEI